MLNKLNLLNNVFQRILILRNRHFLYVDLIIFLITPILSLYLRLDDFNVFRDSQFELKIYVLS